MQLHMRREALPPSGSECVRAQFCWTLGDPMVCSRQAPQSKEFSRQEYWSRLPFPSPEDLPDPGIEPRSPALQADSLLSEPSGKPIIAITEKNAN